MINSLKRITAMICTICIVITLLPNLSDINAHAVSNYTEQVINITKDGQVVDSFQGVNAEYVTYSSDTGYYCCASYVSKFYSTLFGVSVYNINTINGKPTVYKAGHTTELRTVTTPKPGDIMQNKGYTHVAIVKDVSGSEITLIEQNYKYNHWQTGALVATINRKTTASSNYYYRLYIDGVEQSLDSIAPTITSAKASGISGSGFNISANVSDNVKVSTVKVGTYTKSAGANSIKWTTLSNPSANIQVAVKTSDFKNADDTYVTVIEAYDQKGNKATKTLNTYIDTTPPAISNVQISGVTAKGYTVTCTVSDASGINQVKFPTWTTKNANDDMDKNWATGTSSNGSISGNKATFYVNTAKHNNETGEYNTIIYAYDTYGNTSQRNCTTTISPASSITLSSSAITLKKGESKKLTYTLKGNNITETVSWSSSHNVATVSNGQITVKDVGTATITAKTSTGKTANCNVKIVADISTMRFSKIANQRHTGKYLMPGITIKNGSKQLVYGTDYTVSYSNNINLGTGKATIKGIGNYSGSKTLTFKISPSKVTGAKVSKTGDNYINLTWNKYSGVDGYHVYRYNTSTSKWVKIASVTSNSFKDTKLTPCTKYKYKVKAYSTYSGEATSTIEGVTNPLKSKLNLAKAGSQIKIIWNVQSKASGYEVYISKTGKTGTYKLAKTITNSKTKTTVINGYSGGNYIKVRAYKTVNGKKQAGAFSSKKKIVL